MINLEDAFPELFKTMKESVKDKQKTESKRKKDKGSEAKKV